MRTMLTLALLATLPLLTAAPRAAQAHCEVPCGVYGDQLRFESMLEDTATIQRAMVKIKELSASPGALEMNQLVRWVNTKEDHASKTQDVIAQYFMHQRIKSTDANYVERLTKAHAVMVIAMKCKQSVDEADAASLKAAVLEFHKAYAGEAAPKEGAGEHGHTHDTK